ncbi:fluoride efflux transporter CrcB [Paenibacillus guangzhouensis]|uniref:fluoride efflux transporter CrcB n=1 Tax=Paenibacillus guangzhouensis TaxID=1473112 RepID=UPI001266AB3E|nr:fluoride efflux transporter CrcB [Paenibacillus guangzhouensis]
MLWIIGVGGVLGSISRFMLGTWVTSRTSSSYPFGTFVINVSGSFILGCLAAFHGQHEISEMLYAFFGIGFCGAYTTFSTFGVETIRLLERKRTAQAIIYVISSVVISIVVAGAGFLIFNT